MEEPKPKKHDGNSHRSPPQSGAQATEDSKPKKRDGDTHRLRGSEHRGSRPHRDAGQESLQQQQRTERRHRPDRTSAAQGGDEREHRRHSHRDDPRRDEGRPVQIVQRAGGGSRQLKILGQSSSHRSRPPPPAELSAVPEESREPVPKKKPQFIVPSAAPAFARCRLMDEEWRVCVDAVHPQLLESGSEFTVVACVGAQGVGKSTVLSLLLASFRGLLGKGPSPEPPPPADPSLAGLPSGLPASLIGGLGGGLLGFGAAHPDPVDPDAGFEAPLRVHSAQSFLEGQASPPGVDLCVSCMDRLLLLDAQPLFGCGALPEAELKAELYLLTFLSSVCHTLLVVTDTPVDLQLWRFLRLLATLKTKVPDLASWVEQQNGGAEGRPEQARQEQHVSLPRIVIAFNKLGGEREGLYEPVQAFLEHTLWRAAPSLQCIQIPQLPGSCLSALLTSHEAHRAGLRLRERVLTQGPERGRFGKDKLQLTEREWLYHISGYWDFVQKVPSVQDYFSRLGQGLESYGWPKC